VQREIDALCRSRGLTDRERLDVLETVWLQTAERVRDAALALPNCFPDEQRRQVEVLDAMAEIVREATPDLEGHRLHLEGDAQGWLNHARMRRDAAREQREAREARIAEWDRQNPVDDDEQGGA
jgi:hypothetical protein